MLFRSGVPWLQLVDFDYCEVVNLAPQGFLEEDVGRPKVEATADLCRRINSGVEVNPVIGRFRRSMAIGNVLFACVDSIDTRRLIWEAVRDRASLFVDGRMSAETLRVLAVADDRSATHYLATLFPPEEAHAGACTAKSTIYCANIAAGWMVSALTRWLRHLPVEPDITLNLLAGEVCVGQPVSA